MEGEIEDEEYSDEYYTEDEDHIHGDSEEEGVVKRLDVIINYVEDQDILDEEQQELLDRQRALTIGVNILPQNGSRNGSGQPQGQGHARLSFHLRNMVGNAKTLATSSGSAGSEMFQELISSGAHCNWS